MLVSISSNSSQFRLLLHQGLYHDLDVFFLVCFGWILHFNIGRSLVIWAIIFVELVKLLEELVLTVNFVNLGPLIVYHSLVLSQLGPYLFKLFFSCAFFYILRVCKYIFPWLSQRAPIFRLLVKFRLGFHYLALKRFLLFLCRVILERSEFSIKDNVLLSKVFSITHTFLEELFVLLHLLTPFFVKLHLFVLLSIGSRYLLFESVSSR